jgi:hypothetical protein
MNWEAIGAIAEVLGACAVFLTLVYLAVQIRQNTTALQSAASQSIHENFAEWYSRTQSDPELLDLSIRGMEDYACLTQTERAQFIGLFMSFCIHMQNAFYKWREGSLSPELWRGWEFVSLNIFATPGGKQFWNERRYLFADAFQEYVKDDIMTREPHPDAKGWGAIDIPGSQKATPRPPA